MPPYSAGLVSPEVTSQVSEPPRSTYDLSWAVARSQYRRTILLAMMGAALLFHYHVIQYCFFLPLQELSEYALMVYLHPYSIGVYLKRRNQREFSRISDACSSSILCSPA